MEENNIMPDNKDITPAADGNIPDEQNPKQNEDTIGAVEAVAVAEAVAMAQQASGAGDQTDGMAVKKVNVSIIDGGRDGSGTGKKKTAPILKFIKGHKNYIFVFFLAAIILFAAYAVFGVHPFGDMSVLVLDLNGQYVYYFENLRDILHGDGSPFISWSRNLSGEIMGMFAYYLASPFTLIPMVLPRSWMTESLLIMQLCKVGTAAVTFYYYLKHSQNCRSSTCMIFSLLYSLMGYMIVQLMNPMWLDGLIYLPLIIYGIEKIIDENSWLRFIIPLALMFMAHFYIGWMIVFFSIIYFIYYYFAGKRDFTFSFKSFFFAGIKFATGGVIAACTAGWVLLPLYYSLSLGKFEFSTPSYTVKTQFEFLDFFKNLLPNVYDTCRPEGSPIVYCGVITLILVPLFFLNSKVRFRQKMGLGAVLASVLLSMYLSTADLAWHGFQVPNWLPYRYSFTFSFVLLVMAAIAFERLEGISLKDLGVTCAAIAVYAFTISTKEIKGVDLVLSVWYCVLFVLVYGIFLRFIKISKKNIRAVLTYVMAIFIVGELFGSSLATMTAINKDVVYSKYSSYNRYISLGRETVKQLYGLDSFDDNGGVYRVEKNHHRTVNDPMAFGTFGISHSSSTLNSAPIQFLRKLGFSYGGHYIKYKGSTYVTDALLGIKYVMEKGDTPPAPDPDAEAQENIGADNGDGTSLDEETGKPEDLLPTNKHYSELVLTNSDEKDTWAVYKNPYALPVAFMADSSILDVTLDKDNPFVNQNELLSHLVSDEYTEYFKQIFVSSTVPENARQSSYGTHTKYTPVEQGKNCHIEFLFTPPTEDMVYFYMPSSYERTVNLWLNKEFLDYYFEGGKMVIQTLGRFSPDEEVSLIVTVTEDKKEVLFKDKLFYYLDEAAFADAVNTLKQHGLVMSEFSEDHIKGTITAEKDGVMFTTISWEPGWTIKVDGEKVEPVKVCDALIGIELTAGQHEIEMSFFPEGLTTGIILTLTGLVSIIIIALTGTKAAKTSEDSSEAA